MDTGGRATQEAKAEGLEEGVNHCFSSSPSRERVFCDTLLYGGETFKP